jgi:hypothetical protein
LIYCLVENQKTIFALVAIIATVGILIAASTIATPSALALKLVKEKDTKNNRNSAERTSIQESDTGHHQPPG